jgi:hypothetical protein
MVSWLRFMYFAVSHLGSTTWVSPMICEGDLKSTIGIGAVLRVRGVRGIYFTLCRVRIIVTLESASVS